MIDSGAVEQRQVFLRVLSDDQILEIQRAAFDILQNVGVKILHTDARKMLKQAGAQSRTSMSGSRSTSFRNAFGQFPKALFFTTAAAGEPWR